MGDRAEREGWEPCWDFPRVVKLFVHTNHLDKPIALTLTPPDTFLVGNTSNILRLNYLPAVSPSPPWSPHLHPELATNKLFSSYWLSKNMAALRCEMFSGIEGSGAISSVELGLSTGTMFIRKPTLFSYSPKAGGEARLPPRVAVALGRASGE